MVTKVIDQKKIKKNKKHSPQENVKNSTVSDEPNKHPKMANITVCSFLNITSDLRWSFLRRMGDFYNW